MKSTKDFRPINGNDGDSTRKATKLEPIKKSGREKSSFYKSIDNEDDDDLDYKQLKRESILDYFDDGQDPDELDDDDLDDDFEDEDEDFEEEEDEDEDK